MKRTLLFTLGMLLVSSMALAQTKASSTTHKQTTQKRVKRLGGISCGSDPILPTDGYTTIYDFVPPSSSSYYLVHLKNGHSYGAEVYDSTDATISATAQLSLISASDCATVLPTTDVVSIDPDLSNDFADRISWIQSGDADAVLVVANPDSTVSYSYNIRIADTTLVNPRWSTFSGFITQYAFVNNTETTITGTLTLVDNTAGGPYTTNFTVPAGGESFQTVPSSSLNVPPNHFGFATFAFVGPAGAIVADAYFINPSGTVIVPSIFAPRNYQH